ncbi:MAG: UDP-4-amino-4-deoxy-L-arabinose--oxoglutarate aminotransferase [Bacteroidota bacterium]|jgi:aminotransferase in exopolysaccharide biosynthesis
MSKQALFDQVITVIREQFSSQDFIPLHEPRFIGNEKQYLNECIDSTFVSSVGPFVDRFESTIAHLTGTKHGVAVVNGTAALQVALQVVGVQPNEEVITQALTFVATANAIAYRQAKPVFIDVDLDTMGLSPKALLAFLEKHAELRSNGAFNLLTGKRIGAVVVMHTFGFPAHVLELAEICQKWKIPLVEDAAESLGSTINGQQTGSFGTVGIFSFNGNKIVTSGGGGAIVTNDSSLAKKAKHLTTTAKVPHAYDYEHDELGYNFRMPNINAALACAQLEKLPYFLEQKQRLAQKYKVQFDQLGIKLRWSLPNTSPNYWLLCLEFADRATRNDFLDYAIESNVMCRPIWKLLIDLPMYQDCYHDGLANSRFLEDRIVNIPSSVQL